MSRQQDATAALKQRSPHLCPERPRFPASGGRLLSRSRFLLLEVSAIGGIVIAPNAAQASFAIVEGVQYSILEEYDASLVPWGRSPNFASSASSSVSDSISDLISDRTTIQSNSVSSPSETALEWSTPVPTLENSTDSQPSPPDSPTDTRNPESPPTLAQADETQLDVDPELGTLRLRPTPDPNLNPPRTHDGAGDPELGVLRLQESPAPDQPTEPDRPETSRYPSVYLLGGINFLRSDNIFSSQVDPVGDSLFIPGLSLYAQPQIGSDTYLVAAASGYLFRYVDFSDVDYNELRLRVGIRQILSPQMYGEVNWINSQLFDRSDGDRFLDDHAMRLLLVRSDAIAPRLSLDSFYLFRIGFANPPDRSRISNSLGVGLAYDVTPDLDVALDYRVSWTVFTEDDRDDFYNQVTASVIYDLTSRTQLSAYGGFSFGDSTRSDINFNSGVFGLGINFALPLF